MEACAAVAASVPAVLQLAKTVSENSETRDSVSELKHMLTTFNTYLSVRPQGCKLVEVFANQIQDLIFEIENALDEFMYSVSHRIHHSKIGKDLHHAGHGISNLPAAFRLCRRKNKIKEQMKSIAELHRTLTGDSQGKTSGSSFSEHVPILGNQDEMVGFEERRLDLINQLVEGEKARLTIQVLGPGGSGKTFLVNKVFKDEKVQTSFHCKAWILMPVRFNIGSMLTEVLMSFCSRIAREKIMEEAGSIQEKIAHYLSDKKYLIVLDNLSCKQDYEAITNSLPCGLTGSRVVITTRNSVVVDKADHVHKLSGLDRKEAWELFCGEAFRGTDSPVELREIGKRIVQRCDLLPLPIVVLARLLSRKQQSHAEWDKFHNNICYELSTSNDSSLLDRILKPSFIDLSDNVRSCFLYFSMFPEGHTVTRGRLIRSWISEGFIEEVRGKTSEEVAETYINELIERSLVQVITPDHHIASLVKCFKVLRLHHDFIVHELYRKSNNLFAVVDERNPKPPPEPIHHLSVNHSDAATKVSEIDDPSYVRTLFVFGKQQESKKQEHNHFDSMLNILTGTAHNNKLENAFARFRLLKVLDLQCMPLSEFPKNIDAFLLLRSLNLRGTCISTIPRSIKKLVLLESLDLKYTLVKELPKYMRKLQRLRHLLVSTHSSRTGSEGVELSFGIGSLHESLHQVSLIKVKHETEFFNELGRLESLRKLSLADLREEEGSALCESMQKMKNLSKFHIQSSEGAFLDLDHEVALPIHIECLRLNGKLRTLPRWLPSLRSLVKLVLKGSKLEADQKPLETLEVLPTLLELEMVDYYTGTKLKFAANSFKTLRKLHIEMFDQLITFEVQENAMPSLEKLTICKCVQLGKLPRGLCVRKLEELVVYDMSDAFVSDVTTRVRNFKLVHFKPNDTATSSFIGTAGSTRSIVSRRYLS